MAASRLFPPEHSLEEVSREVEDTLRQTPWNFGIMRSRWTLDALRQQVEALNGYSLSGVHRLLRRMEWYPKRAVLKLHSPDALYQEKREHVLEMRKRVVSTPNEEVFYFDSMSVEFEPSVKRGYGKVGEEHPQIDVGQVNKGRQTYMGALQVSRGEVTASRAKGCRRQDLLQFWEQLCERYSTHRRLWIVLDNAPVHFHPDVLRKLEPQLWPWEYPVPPNWAPFCEHDRVSQPLPIQLVPLPTYSPWLNPIEKLWRLLRQRVVHNFPDIDSPTLLLERIDSFFQALSHGDNDLLHYVGLLPN